LPGVHEEPGERFFNFFKLFSFFDPKK
jgi:hypothetical protein